VIRPRSRPSPSHHRAADPERQWAGLVVAVLVVLTLTAYLPVHRADWVQDDHLAVEKNPVVARGDLVEILTTHYWAGAAGEDATLYRPIPVLTWAAERAVVGHASSGVAHLVNAVLHLLAALLLHAYARRLGAGSFAAAAAALLFAVHPVHVEAVAGIVGRAEILATLGTLGALWTASWTGPWRDRPAPAPARRRLAAWACAGFVFVGLGSKEIAVAVVPLLAIQDVLFRGGPGSGTARDRIARVAALAPAALATTLWYLLRVRALEAWWVTQSPHPMDNPLIALDAAERIGTALGLVARYVGLLVFPVRLSADYSGGAIRAAGPLDPLALVGLALLAGFALLVVRPAIPLPRTRPGGGPGARVRAMAAALFLVPYLVIGNLLVPVGTIFAERLAYLPSAGFCVLVGALLGSLALDYPAFPAWSPGARIRYAGIVLVLVLAAFSVQTHARATVWRDDRSVFAAAAASHPDSPRPWLVLGMRELEDGRPAEALARFERALATEPRYMPAWYQSGLALAGLGRYDEAIDRFRRTIELSPTSASAHLNLGLALQRTGRLDEAERAVRRAALHDPNSATAWATLGHLALQRGLPARAIEPYRRAVALGRDDLRPRLRALESGLDPSGR